jgi:pimeloyl-ACP methyl ester carboxylesterase
MSNLQFSRSGSGEPLVLIHGIGDTRAAWSTVVEPLSEHHEVYAVDLPGFGRTPALPATVTPTPQALARVVAAWMDGQGLASAHLVGSSLGGWVSLEVAGLGRARTVLGLSPAGFAGDPDRRRAMRMLILVRGFAQRLAPVERGMSPRLRRLLRPPVVRLLTHSSMVARPWRWPADEAFAAIEGLAAAAGWDGTLAALAEARYAPPPGGLDVPVTLAWGAEDRLLPPRQRVRVHEVLPNARVGLLPGCGHLPMWDDPDLVVRAVLTSTARVRAAG